MTWTIKKSKDKRGRIPVDCWNLFRDDELQGITCWTEEHAQTACAALNEFEEKTKGKEENQ